MKFRYTLHKSSKTIPIEMSLSTMSIYKRYLKAGYEIVKREILDNGKWVEFNKNEIL